jgi:hypothetical protein
LLSYNNILYGSSPSLLNREGEKKGVSTFVLTNRLGEKVREEEVVATKKVAPP